ncbi:MAG: hypothetical protein IPG80_08820 [Anaerolineales bacterium]|uniref:hypothetical protein n=1 Tax=Candidatus Villigracilis vicinus TaxID=3140679 RepID=UPI003137470C|nr:hypothetical protein [Anaerolineales bacterium]
MDRKIILYRLFIFASILFGIATIGLGVYLFLNGRDCRSYNDYSCAFRAMFSAIVIPYGLVILLFVGLTSLQNKTASLIGSVLSALLGLVHLGMCCVIALGAASNAGDSLMSSEMGRFLLFPLAVFAGGVSLFGVGVLGFLRTK